MYFDTESGELRPGTPRKKRLPCDRTGCDKPGTHEVRSKQQGYNMIRTTKRNDHPLCKDHAQAMQAQLRARLEIRRFQL